MPEKKRSLLVPGIRRGTDKMERTWLCENTMNLYKDVGDIFCENNTAADLNHPEFLGKYGNRPDKKWQSWLGKLHWSGEEVAVYVLGKQQKAADTQKRCFGGKFLCPGQKMAKLFKGKQLWAGQKACQKAGKDGEDFLEENESMPEKKRSLLVAGKRHGSDKM
ncbi:hypothetical protein T10_615 [Trichinella papuae]|uniref:Uncharacterized protein n=1 Tax=Trichinella papuae TaxID=268474 RepID=A0A0V1M4T5_9BILA|nr:hypothetical protein T10_615 [Trichinella papuae]